MHMQAAPYLIYCAQWAWCPEIPIHSCLVPHIPPLCLECIHHFTLLKCKHVVWIPTHLPRMHVGLNFSGAFFCWFLLLLLFGWFNVLIFLLKYMHMLCMDALEKKSETKALNKEWCVCCHARPLWMRPATSGSALWGRCPSHSHLHAVWGTSLMQQQLPTFCYFKWQNVSCVDTEKHIIIFWWIMFFDVALIHAFDLCSNKTYFN